jgi:hypothetical protein
MLITSMIGLIIILFSFLLANIATTQPKLGSYREKTNSKYILIRF